MASNEKSKPELILDCATRILQDEGDAALSMRQIAARTGMSLSNLQYYFRDKDTLLIALADRYFGECIALLKEYASQPKSGNEEKQLRALILFFLDHVEELSDMCRVFRELWAISTRNKAIDKHLKTYYKDIAGELGLILEPLYKTSSEADKAVSILLPFFEGYSLTNKALPLNKKQVCEVLVKTLKSHSNSRCDGGIIHK